MFENVLVEISVGTFLCIFHNFGRSLNCNFTPKLINVLGQTSRTVLFQLEITAGCYEAKFVFFANARFSGKKNNKQTSAHVFCFIFPFISRKDIDLQYFNTLPRSLYYLY